MKKPISLLLILVLCLNLCACGKSAEAKAVDDMILAIGEVTADNASAVQEALEAYEALSEADRQSVENYAVLESAQEELIIPMDPRCESLNAAIAAAIVMWQMKQSL